MQFETVRSEVKTDPEARGGKIGDIQDRIVHFMMVIVIQVVEDDIISPLKTDKEVVYEMELDTHCRTGAELDRGSFGGVVVLDGLPFLQAGQCIDGDVTIESPGFDKGFLEADSEAEIIVDVGHLALDGFIVVFFRLVIIT